MDELFKLQYDTPLTIDLEEEEKEVLEEPKEKEKKKRNVFFGVKTKRHFARSGYGSQVVYETFHYLKKFQGPPKYAREFYWYNYRLKKIVNSLNVDPKNAAVLHGPYQKIMGEQVLEEGFFFKGQKHLRWVKFTKNDILVDKKYYYRGWPEESRLAYYDFERSKIREVVPIHYDEKEGEFWAFHKNGRVAVKGQYKHNYKIGLWREYYYNGRLKREVAYPEAPFNDEFSPFIKREWDERGQVIYDRKEFLEEMEN